MAQFYMEDLLPAARRRFGDSRCVIASIAAFGWFLFSLDGLSGEPE